MKERKLIICRGIQGSGINQLGPNNGVMKAQNIV